MKRLRILSIFMVLFTALGSMVSCETEPVDPLLLTDDNGGIDPTPDPGVFTVKIGSTLFVADSTVATLGDGFIVIKGYKGTEGENVTITIPATTTGTYAALMVYDPGATLNFYSNLTPAGLPSGSVTITNINTVARTVSGNFNFTGYYSDPTQNIPPTAFTEGTYTNISYAGGTTPPPTGSGILKADVDGVAFSATNPTAILGRGMLTINGFTTEGRTITITVEEITAGTYTDVRFFYQDSITSEYAYSNIANDTGTLTISSIDAVNRTVSGTFSFTGDYTEVSAGLPSKAITNGIFTNVPFTDMVEDTDIFNATVDTTAITYGGSDLVSLYTDSGDTSFIQLRATNVNHVIELIIDTETPVGSYAFNDAINSTPRAIFTDRTGPEDVSYNITRGSFIVNYNDGNRMKGTFSFEVRNPANPDGEPLHVVEEGVFDVEL